LEVVYLLASVAIVVAIVFRASRGRALARALVRAGHP
jgi:hypothetical protein